MRYHVLAADYDGTLAHHGRVSESTMAALRLLRESGRKLVLVTGRQLTDLLEIFPEGLELCDRVVAENGAVIYDPATKQTRALVEPPPPAFARKLSEAIGDSVQVGKVIVATWTPHEIAAVELINEMGLEMQVIFNKGAVMILPSGVNKATGLRAALKELGLSPRNTVGGGRRRERPRLHLDLRVRGGGAERPAGAEGPGRPGDRRRPRHGHRAADRQHGEARTWPAWTRA